MLLLAEATTTLVCSNCGSGSSNTWAAIAAGVAALTALITLGVALQTRRSAEATEKAATATENSAAATEAIATATKDATEATRQSAIATAHAAQAAADEASATFKEAEASLQHVAVTREQIRRAQMPVVMPIADPADLRSPESLRYDGDGIAGVVPTAYEAGDDENSSIVLVPIANVGSGPAFTIQATIEFLDSVGNRSAAGQPMIERAAVLTALGASQAGSLRARFRALALPFLPFTISITFDDAFGDSYQVKGTFFPDQQAYRNLTFNLPADLVPSRTQ